MRMVGPEYWFVCEFERSWSGFRTGEVLFDGDFGGENLGPCANVAGCDDCESA